MSIHYERRGTVAVITLDHPPVNSLGLSTRRALAEGLERAHDDPSVLAVVLAGAGRMFCGGADIREFGDSEMVEPNLLSLVRMLDEFAKPTVAALHGNCLGGGLELSLACHYRVAAAGTRLGLPEVRIGLVPGAGGTQRLPRAVGVEMALNMIVKGDPVGCEDLAALPGQRLIHRVADGDLMDAALALANEVAGQRPLPRLRDIRAEHANPEGYFQFARNTVSAQSRHLPAPGRCVDCVEQAVTARFDDGLAYERAAFVELMHGAQSQALRHAFFAERAATRIADVPADTPLRRIERVAVIGAGTMGSGIAMNFLSAGIPVTMLDTTVQALERGVATLRANYESQVKRRKLDPAKFERSMGLLTTTVHYADVAGADLVIEAVFEEMGVKELVFRTLDEVMKPGAILASNTSTLDVNRIAAATRRPQDVVGLHFFSPANVMKLLEVVRGAHTAKDVLATVMALARRIGKTAVVAGVCDGFIGNRMVEQYLRQAGFLLDEGAAPQQVDRAIEKFGLAMGPFRMSDLAGNDIGWAIRKRRYVDQPQMRYSRSADLLCEMGRFGQKTGAGWYDYRPGQRDAAPSPVVEHMLQAHRQSLGIAPRRIDDDEIVQRLVWALVNEGARILDEGIAQRASDIDMVYLTGYGFPLWRGGPMKHADTVGLFNVARAMKRFARNPRDDAAFWQPARLLARLAAEGKTFN